MTMRIGWTTTSVVAIALSFFGALATPPPARAQNPPAYKVDPFWPKRLPNKWSMQQIVDIYVDKEDHVWVLNRASDARPDELGAATTPPRTECCVMGPEVVEFDTDGSVLRAWGGKDYVPGWPGRLQTIGVDRDENVWISGTTPGDSIIKFTKDGKFLWDFGHRGPKVPASEVKQNNQQTAIFPPGIAASGSKDVRARASLRPPFEGWIRLRLRARQRQNPGVHQAGQICKTILDSPVDAIPRSALRRHLEHNRSPLWDDLQSDPLDGPAAKIHLGCGRHKQYGLDPQS